MSGGLRDARIWNSLFEELRAKYVEPALAPAPAVVEPSDSEAVVAEPFESEAVVAECSESEAVAVEPSESEAAVDELSEATVVESEGSAGS